MFLKELGVFILFYIQVSTAEIYLGLSLLGVKPGLKKVLTIGLIHGFTMFFARYLYSVLDIPMGIHIIFSVISYIVASKYVAQIKWSFAVAAALIASISSILSEALLVPIFLNFINISADVIFLSLWLHVAAGYFTSLLTFILAFLVTVTGFSFIKSSQKSKIHLGE